MHVDSVYGFVLRRTYTIWALQAYRYGGTGVNHLKSLNATLLSIVCYDVNYNLVLRPERVVGSGCNISPR